MLRDVVVHIANEQPILADLLVEPKPSDVVLICTNLRTMGGKKPVFIDKTDSTFMLPLAHVRFVEIPQASMAASDSEQRDVPEQPVRARKSKTKSEPVVEEEEYAAVPLGRLAWLAGLADEPPSLEPSAKELAIREEPAPAHNPDEIDPELLRRIHEV
jgi:hypothetical protein